VATLRILLVDDHALVRAGMRSLLHDIADIEVVAEASDGAEALAAAERERPDVVLMDIAMKGMNGLEAAARLRERQPEAKIIILSMHTSEEYVLLALRAGAAAYLIKDSATSELELALKCVMRGDTYLSPAISRQVVDGYVQRVGVGAGPDPLTPRQRDVLKRIAEGRSTKEIAFDLNLSVKTVETHRAQIMDRLGIRDVAGLVRYAMRTGLVPPETKDFTKG
jgi:DNA-binding NarL/FixJ family response regulator